MRIICALIVPALVALGLASGLLREVILAHYFGASRELEIFRVAFGVPSILSDSLAISFVSVLLPTLTANPDRNGLRSVLWPTLLLACAFGLIGVLSMPLQAKLLAPGMVGEERDMLIFAGRLCWGMFFAVIISLPLRAAMSAQNCVWPSASAPFFRSGGFIAALLILIFFGAPLMSKTTAIAALVAGIVVLSLQYGIFLWRKTGGLWNALRAGPERENMWPIISGLSAVFLMQLLLSSGRIMDRMVASNMQVGTLAGLEYSYALIMATAAILGTSTNIFLAPKLNRSLQSGAGLQWAELRLIFGVIILAGLASFIMFVFAEDLVRLIYETGQLKEQEVLLISTIFSIHILGLSPVVAALIFTQLLILSGGQKTTLLLAVMKLVFKAALLFSLIQSGFGIKGVAMSFVLTECVMFIAILYRVRVRKII